MKAMLDSDTCIYLMNRHSRMVPQEPLHEYCISTVVLGELEYGALNSQYTAKNQAKLRLFLGSITIFELGAKEAKIYAELRCALKHQPIGPNDLWIAAHAVALQLSLVTNNTHEFKRVPRLTINTWLQK